MKKIRSATAIFTTIIPLMGLIALFCLCVAALYAFNSFGRQWAVGATVGTILAGVILGPRLLPGSANGSTPGRQARWLRHARKPFVVVLACWLLLIGWSKLSPGGPPPAPKTEPSSIRVVTWNILRSQESGSAWSRLSLTNWAGRKGALRDSLHATGPDILCVQEALQDQVAFLEEMLPAHRRVGVGRDDGRSAGEHCAICFNADRFEQIGGDTFWLEEPTDQPRDGAGLKIKRICTWVRLRDRVSGRTIRVYNVHSYLTEKARVAAAQVVLDHVTAGDPADAIILAGDFNAPPGSPSRRLFTDAGLTDSAERASGPCAPPTYQWYGLRVRCLDGILVSPGWQVRQHRVLDLKPGNTFPSDHFGLLADLTFPDR